MRINLAAALVLAESLAGIALPAYAQVDPPFSEVHVIEDDLAALWTIEMVDLDQDGDLDLLSGGQGGSSDPLEWHENEDGHGHRLERHLIDMDARFSNRVILDLDGDGDLDVVGGNRDGIVWEENLGGAGAWESRWLVEGVDARWVEVADFDGDGVLDLLSGGSDVMLHRGRAGESMTWSAPRVLSDRDVQLMHVDDLDGDGDTDFVVGTDFNDDDMLRFFFNEGGTFSERDVHIGFDFASLESADLDGDGDADLVVGTARDLFVLENRGDGVFTPDVIDGAPVGSGGRYFSADYLVAPGDYDLDGDVDIVAAADHEVGLRLFDNDGSGSFTMRQLDSRQYRGHTIDVGDMDCDGDLDFVWGLERDPGAVDAPEDSAWYENELIDADAESCHGPRSSDDPPMDDPPMDDPPMDDPMAMCTPGAPCISGCSVNATGGSPMAGVLALLGLVALMVRRRR